MSGVLRRVKLFLRGALSSCILGRVTVSYAEVLAKNMRAARARLGLEQEPLAARMRALGFSAWRRQTVASAEKNTRRLTAEEVLGLAVALETRITALLEPVQSDDPIALPSGAEMRFETMHELIWGGSIHGVQWNDDVPSFPTEGPPPGWPLDYPDSIPPPRVRRNPNPPRYPKSGDES